MGKETSSPRSNIEEQLDDVNSKLRDLNKLNTEVKQIALSAAQKLNRETKLKTVALGILNSYSSKGFIKFDNLNYQLKLNYQYVTFELADLVDLSDYSKYLEELGLKENFVAATLEGTKLLLPVAKKVIRKIITILNSYTGYNFFYMDLVINSVKYSYSSFRLEATCCFKLDFK